MAEKHFVNYYEWLREPLNVARVETGREACSIFLSPAVVQGKGSTQALYGKFSFLFPVAYQSMVFYEVMPVRR